MSAKDLRRKIQSPAAGANASSAPATAKQKPLRLEVLPKDLSAYRRGNTGVDYVHRLDSGRPGPHVLVNALTHGNELCGMVAVTSLLDAGVRPMRGTLTLSLANVAAYESFHTERPFDSRQLVHNLNRIWSDAELIGTEDSPELRRARELRPVVAAADHLLDIHSTSQDVTPFWVYPGYARNAEAALAIGHPSVHLVLPQGLDSGTPLIQFGRFGRADGQSVALVVEFGQHFLQATSATAADVTQRFLAHFGLVPAPAARARTAQRRFELLQTYVIRTSELHFARPSEGFEAFARGELIVTDGETELRAPCDRCTVLMPARGAIVGREGVYLTRPIDEPP